MISSPIASSNSTSATTGTSKTASTTEKFDAAPSPTYATKVTLSGKAIMLSRLFHTTDPSLEPKVETNKSKPSGLVYDFLTQDDRKTIAKLYDYASTNSIDPVKVDNLAFDLACYRQSEGVLRYSGCDYDLTGQPIARSFKPADEAIAQRILTSKAINDTAIDHGFLRQILDPGYFSIHASDFEFLQQAVFAFSASGSDGAADPNANPVRRPRAEDFAPIQITPPDTSGGIGIMRERLFGIDSAGEKVTATVFSPLFDYLTDMDKIVIGNEYEQALKHSGDFSNVDKLALSLASRRWQQQLLAMLGNALV
jgi:hypothetical protein